MFYGFFNYFSGSPGALVQFPACPKVTFYEEFDFAEDHFEEEGLGTGPSAPDAAEGYGEDDDKKDEGEHQQGQDKGVLGPEYGSEDDKFPVGNIEQDQRITVYFNKWRYDKEGQQEICYDHPAGMPFPRGLLGIHPFAVTPGIDVDGPVTEGIFSSFSHFLKYQNIRVLECQNDR